jgi:hypothetical protein
MYKLGQEIIINSRLQRVSEYRRVETGSFNRRYKLWKQVRLKECQTVIVVGVRTLFDGYVDYDPEVGSMFSQENHFKAILVTSKLSQKPFYVKYE